MSKLSFAKYEGAGNDFVLIDDRFAQFPIADREFIQRLCHRKMGVGADGVLLVCRGERAARKSYLSNCGKELAAPYRSGESPSFQEGVLQKADVRMRIFNCDGSEAESCGNGLRCFLRFLIEELEFPARQYAIAVGERIVFARPEGEQVAVDMGRAEGIRLHLPTDDDDDEAGEVHFADTGVPHAVLFVKDVEKVDLPKIGPLIRHHPLFHPRGANVNFAAWEGEDAIRVRTFERGVEGETLACGTGAVAVAAIASYLSLPRPSYRLCFPGGTLEVRRERESFWLIGGAKKVFTGIF